MTVAIRMIKYVFSAPARICTSPLLWRDLRVFLRGWKSFGILFLFLLALSYLVGVNWTYVIGSWNPTASNTPVMRELFFSMARGHLLFLLLFTPFLVATAFFSEREQGTLELLLSSPVSSLHVVCAKLLAPLGFVIVLLIAGVPVLCLCLTAGGISIREIAGTYCLFGVTVLTSGCLGLFCSTLFSRIHQTMIATALITLGLAILIPFHGTVWSLIDPRVLSYMNHMIDPNYSIKRISWVQRLTSAESFSYFGSVNHGMESCSPFYQLYLLIYPPSFNVSGLVVFYGCFSFILCLAFLYGSCWRVAAIVRKTARGSGIRREWNVSPALRGNLFFRDLMAEESSETGFTTRRASELLEHRLQWFARSSSLIRIGYISVIASLCILPIASQDTSVLFFSFPLLMALLVTLPITATRIGIEWEQGTMDMLRITLLPFWDYVRSKYRTCLRYSLTFALTLYAPGMAARLMFGWLGGHRMEFHYKLMDSILVLGYPIFLYCCIRFYTALALCVSASFRKTGRALMVLGMIVLFGMMVPLFFISSGLMDSGERNEFISALAGVSLNSRPPWLVFVESFAGWIKWGLMKGSLFFSPLVGILSVLPRRQAQIWIGSSPHLGFPFSPALKEQMPWEAYSFIALQCFVFLWFSHILLRRTEKSVEELE